MSKPATDIIDKYYKFATSRVQGVTDHLNQVRAVAKKVVDPSPDQTYSLQAFVSDMLGLGISCYDQAFGWLYPLPNPNGSSNEPPNPGT